MNAVINNDLLDRLTATDGLRGDLGLELGAVGAALAYLGSLFQERCPASGFNDRSCPEKPDHLKVPAFLIHYLPNPCLLQSSQRKFTLWSNYCALTLQQEKKH